MVTQTVNGNTGFDHNLWQGKDFISLPGWIDFFGSRGAQLVVFPWFSLGFMPFDLQFEKVKKSGNTLAEWKTAM